MRQSEINAAVRDKIESIPGLPERLYENELAGAIGSRKPTKRHLRVFVIPVGTIDDSVGCDKWIGIIQVSILTRDGLGIDEAVGYGDDIVDAIPKGTTLTSGTSTILIRRAGYIGDSFIADGWHHLNVTIDYEGLK